MKLFLILIASLALSGCETLSLLTMSKVEPAPAAGDVIEAELFYSYKHKNFAISELGLSKEQVKSVEEACFPELDAARKEGREDDLEEQKMMGDGIFLPAAGAMVFDAAVNAVGEHVKGIKEKASQSYSSYIMVPANAFAYANCIVLQRKGADGVRKAGFITQLITDGDQGTYFYLQPVLAWAKNSVALTKCNDNCYWGNNKQGEMRIPRHPATQSTLIWPGIPRPSGHLFHGHPAGQSERSDAGVALLVRVGWRRQFLRPFAH